MIEWSENHDGYHPKSIDHVGEQQLVDGLVTMLRQQLDYDDAYHAFPAQMELEAAEELGPIAEELGQKDGFQTVEAKRHCSGLFS